MMTRNTSLKIKAVRPVVKTRFLVQVSKPDGIRQNFTVQGRSRNWLRATLISKGDRYQYFSQLIVKKRNAFNASSLRKMSDEYIYDEAE